LPPSFEEAYEGHVGPIYAYFAYRLGSREDAEDLTQLTFERALRAWRRYDERRASVMSWLLAIARNALIDYRRRDRSPRQISLSRGEAAEDELRIAADPEDERLGPSPELAAALGGVRSRDREVIALRFGADLTIPEIAETMGLSVANVQQIISRTLRRLRRMLETGESQPRASATGAGGRSL
jgi:RNA polymerase sigma factor (sigma-70 family)